MSGSTPRCGSGPNLCLEGPPPQPPLQLEDPSLTPKPFPPRPLPPSSPHPPWLFLQCSGRPGPGAAQSGVGGGVLGGGVEGEGPPAVLGARPISGGTRMSLGGPKWHFSDLKCPFGVSNFRGLGAAFARVDFESIFRSWFFFVGPEEGQGALQNRQNNQNHQSRHEGYPPLKLNPRFPAS